MVLRLLLLAVLLLPATAGAQTGAAGQLARIDHVADGDTVDLTNGAKVRLVQIDTPEVYFTPECYGSQASRLTKRLLPPARSSGCRPSPRPTPSTNTVAYF